MDSAVAYEPGKIPGVKLRLGSQDFIVPPLNISGVERHEAAIEKVNQPNGQLSTKEMTSLICEVVLSAIQRNYPEVTLAQLKDWVDLGNVQDIFMAVMGQSGFKPGNGAVPGEAKGV